MILLSEIGNMKESYSDVIEIPDMKANVFKGIFSILEERTLSLKRFIGIFILWKDPKR